MDGTYTSQPASALLTRFVPRTEKPTKRLFSRMLRVFEVEPGVRGSSAPAVREEEEEEEERGPCTRTRWSSTRRSV